MTPTPTPPPARGSREEREESVGEQFWREHPWLMRWEYLKVWLPEKLIWSWHPRRNRWCKTCSAFLGNSRADAKRHTPEVCAAGMCPEHMMTREFCWCGK